MYTHFVHKNFLLLRFRFAAALSRSEKAHTDENASRCKQNGKLAKLIVNSQHVLSQGCCKVPYMRCGSNAARRRRRGRTPSAAVHRFWLDSPYVVCEEALLTIYMGAFKRCYAAKKENDTQSLYICGLWIKRLWRVMCGRPAEEARSRLRLLGLDVALWCTKNLQNARASHICRQRLCSFLLVHPQPRCVYFVVFATSICILRQMHLHYCHICNDLEKTFCMTQKREDC